MASTEEFLKNAAGLFVNRSKIPALSSSVLHSHLSSKLSSDSTKCHHCNSPFLHSCSLKIVPKRVMSKRMKKLVLKSETSVQLLYRSKFQASLLKKCNKSSTNKLVVSCLVCHKKNVKAIEKPIKIKSLKLTSRESNNEHDKDRPLKRKKKKDRLVGLKAFAVEEANLSIAKFDTESDKLRSKMKKVTQTEPTKTSLSVPESSTFKSFSTENVETDRNRLENKIKVSRLIQKQPKCVKKVAKGAPAAMLVVRNKFKKGSKLQAMLQTADAAKQLQKKKEKKTNFLDSLQRLLEK